MYGGLDACILIYAFTIIGLFVTRCIKPESDMPEACFELQIMY